MNWIDAIGIGAASLALAYIAFALSASYSRSKRAEKADELEISKLKNEIELLHLKQNKEKKAVAGWAGTRKFKVERKQHENEDICSFYLKAHDNKPIPSFNPGQYLTFTLKIPGQNKPVIRCYSLSDAPNSEYFRVSIKRALAPRKVPDAPNGLGSNFFHDQINEGDIIDVKAPSGHFYFNTPSPRPVVLIGGGIGLTPVLSMLNQLSKENDGRKIYFYYGIRNGKENALRQEMAEAAQRCPNIELVICYSAPLEEDVLDEHYDVEGRVSVELFKQQLPSNNFDFYLCGPPPMMESLTKDLKAWGVPDNQVHYETFGPSTVKKTQPTQKEEAADATAKVVHFTKSKIKAPWTSEVDSILELAESCDISVPSGCRAGNCGTCNLAVNNGNFKHIQEPGAEVEDGTCLACIAVPEADIEIDA